MYSTVHYHSSNLYSMYTFEMLTFLLLFIKIRNVINIVIYNNDDIHVMRFKELLKFSTSCIVEKIDQTKPNILLAATQWYSSAYTAKWGYLLLWCFQTAKRPFPLHELTDN